MPKTELEKAISEAAQLFASKIVDAVKNATLQELMTLQNAEGAPLAPPKTRGPGRPPGSTKNRSVAAATKTAKRPFNYPKCAFPGCDKNRFARGKGFCGDHWRQWKAGKIKSAEEYRK